MSYALVCRVLALLILIVAAVPAVATVNKGLPFAMTILIVVAGLFTSAVCLINAHYAPR